MAGSACLYLVPNTLDFGSAEEPADLRELLPLGAIRIAAGLGHWLSENARTTRAFLKRVDGVCPLQRPLQAIAIVELPRLPKGRADTAPDFGPLLAPAHAGHDMGLISEAGLPAVADPGAGVVAAAHAAGLRVIALPGACSLTLAIAASGLNGQSFAFLGYLPVQGDARAARIHEVEAVSRRLAQTQVVIETPYRNAALRDALVAHLQPTTVLAISVGLTLASAFTRSDAISRWRSHPKDLPGDVPAVFSFLAR